MVKQGKLRAVLTVLLIAVLLTGVVMGVSPASPLGSGRVSSMDDAAAFLLQLGWECDIAKGTSLDTTLPSQYDETFIGYNSIQLQQGCDLTKYAEKTVTVYTIPVTNYPNADGTVLATLLVYKGTVIGGDIHSAEMDGFMHGLK